MNLTKFFAKYKTTDVPVVNSIPSSIRKRVDSEFLAIIEQLGGKTFNGGLYRVYQGDQIEEKTEMIGKLCAAIKGQAIAFAADWMGRQFVIDFTQLQNDKPTVVCLEPGVPSDFCTDQPIGVFHTKDLIENADGALAESYFKKWRKKHKECIPLTHCVGFKLPLFLGGAEDLENLELTDMDVYLEMCCQLWNAVKNLPEGASIKDIIVEPPRENDE